MRSRGFEVNGDSLGTNPVVKADDVADSVKSGPGGFLTEKEVIDRANRVDPLKIKQTGV